MIGKFVTAALCTTLSSGAVLFPTRANGQQVTVTLTEGPNIAATVSPDHTQLIVDLQGALWSLPITGGTATRLTDEFLEPARPAWSMPGDSVAFQAYRGGTFHIWTMNPDGMSVRRLTDGRYA